MQFLKDIFVANNSDLPRQSVNKMYASKLVKMSAAQNAFDLTKGINKGKRMPLIRGNAFSRYLSSTVEQKEVCGSVKLAGVDVSFSVDAVSVIDNALVEFKYVGTADSSADIPHNFLGMSLLQSLFYTALYRDSESLREYGKKTQVEEKLKNPKSVLVMGSRNDIAVWAYTFEDALLEKCLDHFTGKVEAILDAANYEWDAAKSWPFPEWPLFWSTEEMGELLSTANVLVSDLVEVKPVSSPSNKLRLVPV